MTEDYFRQQVWFTNDMDLSDEDVIHQYSKTHRDQASYANRFEVVREEERLVLYLLWSKH